mmetsp:Transcript_3247/g.9384  ORF Transcript_3247/g.9384 Transcript_3247/m.9384 type:complete len:287 (+) Transcript_3247:164-1024(+)
MCNDERIPGVTKGLPPGRGEELRNGSEEVAARIGELEFGSGNFHLEKCLEPFSRVQDEGGKAVREAEANPPVDAQHRLCMMWVGTALGLRGEDACPSVRAQLAGKEHEGERGHWGTVANVDGRVCRHARLDLLRVDEVLGGEARLLGVDRRRVNLNGRGLLDALLAHEELGWLGALAPSTPLGLLHDDELRVERSTEQALHQLARRSIQVVRLVHCEGWTGGRSGSSVVLRARARAPVPATTSAGKGDAVADGRSTAVGATLAAADALNRTRAKALADKACLAEEL